jgi:hypothetical protein
MEGVLHMVLDRVQPWDIGTLCEEDQQEINEVFLCNIVTKKSPKDNDKEEEVNKRAFKNFGPQAENENNSSEGTPTIENKTTTGRKRKQVDHLEG